MSRESSGFDTASSDRSRASRSCTLLSALLLLPHAAQAQSPSSSLATPPSEPPPPLPPQVLEPLSHHATAELARRLRAPPPSPPYGQSQAGRREEGRGWLLQQKLRDLLAEKLAILRGRNLPAVHAALDEISMLALESTIAGDGRSSWLSGVHPVAFRRACVANAARSGGGSGSVVEALCALLGAERRPSVDVETQALALQALEAIALDDPTTDVDNDHQLAIAATGVLPRVVELLGSPTARLPTRAAALTAALAENAQCAKMLLGAGCIAPLLAIARHGGDAARRHALGALRVLSLDRDARERIVAAGGTDSLLRGLATRGPAELRAVAAEFAETLDGAARRQAVAIDARAHARQARATRIGQSKLRQSRVASRAPPDNERAGSG